MIPFTSDRLATTTFSFIECIAHWKQPDVLRFPDALLERRVVSMLRFSVPSIIRAVERNSAVDLSSSSKL